MTTTGRTFVKICGITSLPDARMAIRAGANALGFVFAPGPRRMEPDDVRAITSHVHPTVRRIGVVVDEPVSHVVGLVERANLDGVQLHGTEPPDTLRELREAMPALFVVKAIRVGGPQTIDDGVRLREEGLADAVLLDTKDPADLDAHRPTIAAALAPGGVTAGPALTAAVPIDGGGPVIDRIVVAGGLTPENVAPLVRGMRPWGVDVSSGVESEPGRKDPDKVRAFVRAVRDAERA